MTTPKERLEELRTELRAERISYGELAELASLKEFIEKGDVELLEAAGVPDSSCPHEDDVRYGALEQVDGDPLYRVTCMTCGKDGIIHLVEDTEDWSE